MILTMSIKKYFSVRILSWVTLTIVLSTGILELISPRREFMLNQSPH